MAVGSGIGVDVGIAAMAAAVVASTGGSGPSAHAANKTAARLNTLASAAKHGRDGFGGGLAVRTGKRILRVSLVVKANHAGLAAQRAPYSCVTRSSGQGLPRVAARRCTLVLPQTHCSSLPALAYRRR